MSVLELDQGVLHAKYIAPCREQCKEEDKSVVGMLPSSVFQALVDCLARHACQRR